MTLKSNSGAVDTCQNGYSIQSPVHQNFDLVFQFRSHRLISPPTDRDGNEKLTTGAAAECVQSVVAAVYASSIAACEPPSAAEEEEIATEKEENVTDAVDGIAVVE
uniref:Uncharacterized protein n=1 Tax=Noccaea caerulescens TaxID=107243 RepID=A0A1J3EG22_NOCCA